MKRRILAIVCLALFGLFAITAWLLATESGNQRLLHWALADRLQYGKFTGTLLGELEMHDIRYRDEQQTVAVERLKLVWKPTALFDRLAHVELLHLQGVHYSAAEQTKTDSSAPTDISLPVAVRIDQAEIDGLQLQSGETSQQITRIAISARTLENTIELSHLQLTYDAYSVDGSGRLSLSSGFPFRLTINWQGDIPELGSARGAGNLEGDLEAIKLSHQLQSPFTISTEGQVLLNQSGPTLELMGEWQQLKWPLTEAQIESASGNYRLNGPVQDLQLQAQAQLLLPNTGTPALKTSLQTRLSGAGLSDLKLTIIEIGADTPIPIELNAQGDVSLEGTEPAVTLKGEWSHIRWPMLDASQFTSPEGQFRLEGPVSAMLLDTRIKLNFPQGDAPNLESRIQGTISDSGMQNLKLETFLLGGISLTTGEISWAPSVGWDLAIAAEALDPSQHWPDWPGKLALNTTIQGGITDQGPWLDAVIKGLSGELHNQAIHASGRASYKHTGVDIQDLQLFSGPNRLQVQGTAGDTLNLSYDLKAPDLAAFWPALKGQIEADGRLAGTPSAPQISASIKAQHLGYAGHGIEQVDAHLIWEQGRSTGELKAAEISSGSWHGRALTLEVNGTPEKHRLELRLDADDVQLDAALQGGWQAPLWRGQLEEFQTEQAQIGRWIMESPAALQAGGEKFSLQDFCLAQDSSRLCASSAWSPTDTRVDAILSALPLTRLIRWLPEEIAIDGAVDGEVHLAGAVDALRGDVSVTLPQASLLLELEAEEPLRLDLRDGELKLLISPDKNQARLELKAGDGVISAEASIAAFNPDQPIPLSGQINARMPDLKPIGLLVSGLSNIQGQLNAEIKLGGHLRQPELLGSVDLSGASAHVPQLGLSLQSIRLNAINQGLDKLLLEGELTSGGGQLRVNGELVMDAEQGWPLALKLEGESVQVVQLPEVVAYASPNIDIALQNNHLRIRGELELPRADILIKELPSSAVALSDDEIIIGLEDEINRPSPLGIDAQVRVIIGNEVNFSGFGLNTRLQGAIDLQSTDGRHLAQGELSLKDGRYKAYGQDLSIEQGQFLFNGPPQNPSLNVRVTRLSTDRSVTAILGISGDLRSPQAQVSSRPSLAEEEALSYLLTGKGLSGSGPGKAAILRQVVASNGLEKGQEILDSIGSSVGIDEVTLQEGDVLEDTSLLLGKYLTPDLYVSYAVGLFDNSGALLTRYRLTEKLRLEVQSGTGQSMDIIYDVER